MKAAPFFVLLSLPLASPAQTAVPAESRPGELVGARPSGDSLAKPHGRLAAPKADSDPLQQHLLGSDVNLAQVAAYQLPDLYERFMATTRDERRKWSYPDWDAAGQVLARLNQRYGEVRTGLPLEERVRIRAFQGEFHTLRGARGVKDRLD